MGILYIFRLFSSFDVASSSDWPSPTKQTSLVPELDSTTTSGPMQYTYTNATLHLQRPSQNLACSSLVSTSSAENCKVGEDNSDSPLNLTVTNVGSLSGVLTPSSKNDKVVSTTSMPDKRIDENCCKAQLKLSPLKSYRFHDSKPYRNVGGIEQPKSKSGQILFCCFTL